jgi:hypothetical protein
MTNSVIAPDSQPPNPDSIARERLRIQRRIEGFDWRHSFAWMQLRFNYGERLKQDELVSLADLLARSIGIPLDRDARRRKVVMIKWFEEHWFRIQPFLPMISLA